MATTRRNLRRQGGFIQGTILFALAILGVIIAAFAVSNTGSGTNTDAERDRVNAGVIIKVGSDLQDAVARAMADNWNAKNIDLTGTTNTATPLLVLFDPAYKYSLEPRVPDQAFTDGSWDGAGTDMSITNANHLGTSEDERVIEITGLKDSLCRRINGMVTSTPWDATAPIPDRAAAIATNPSEGCSGASSNTAPFTYYRVVAVDSGS